MIDKKKSPDFMTSVELEEAVREHRAYVRRLLAEARMRRRREGQDENSQSSDSQKFNEKK
jgi:hypothetical protein